MAQLVENLPTMRETLVPFLGWEDLLERGGATHSSILAYTVQNSMDHTVQKSMGSQRHN